MIDVSQIKLQVLMLEAQKTGIEAQLRALKETRCPECLSSYQPGQIEIKEEHDTAGVSTRYEPCAACNGTGFALGERPDHL